MKTFKLLSMLLAAASLLLASCSIDNLGSNDISDGEECLVSFSVQIPGVMDNKTRVPEPVQPTTPTIDPDVPGAASLINKLSYFVYKQVTKYNEYDDPYTTYAPTEISGTVNLTGLSTSVDIRLMRGYKYKVAFWADAFGFAENSPYSIDLETGRVIIDFDGLKSNREDMDAFCGYIDINNPFAGKQQSVTLYRPFAQLNIGTDLTEAAKFGYSNMKTGITVECANAVSITNEYDSCWDGTTRTFELAPCPDGYKFPIEPDKYDYLCLNYIPTPYNDKVVGSSIPVTFNYTIDDGDVQSRTINVPLTRNMRTNIYGDVLISSNKINVTVSPIFSELYGGGDINHECDPSLTPLHDAAKYGGTFVLDEDYDINETIVVSSNFTLDLNGHTISKTADQSGRNAVFKVLSGCTLRIMGYGYVKALGAENLKDNVIVWLDGPGVSSRLYIDGGNFDGCIIADYYDEYDEADDDIIITGGAFKNYKYDNFDKKVSRSLAGGLKLVTISNRNCDWDAVIASEIPLEGTTMTWIENLNDLRYAVDDRDPDAGRDYGRYLYSHRGVTYMVVDQDMTIYASENGTVVDLGEEPFYEMYAPNKVTIGEGITDISDKTFYYAGGVDELSLPSTLRSIGEYAFAGAYFEEFTAPDSLLYIEKGAFKHCGLKKVTLNNRISRINREVFSGCGSLNSIDFPENITYFGAECLSGNNLSEVVIRAQSFEFEDDSIFNGTYDWEPGSFTILYVQPGMMNYARDTFSDILGNYIDVKDISELGENAE